MEMVKKKKTDPGMYCMYMNPPFQIQSRSHDRAITKDYTDFRHMGGAVAQVFPLECLGAIARLVALITPYLSTIAG